jgi:hypothetical protein
MVQAYNSSRKYLGYPTVEVIISSSQWNIPANVSKDPIYDGWYSDAGNEVDPSEFWKTTVIDVTLAFLQSTDVSFANVGARDEAFISYYTLPENKNLVSTAYGFIIEGEVYKAEQVNTLPIPSKAVLIEFKVKKWD